MWKRKVSIFIGSRANYSSAKPIIKRLKDTKNIELQIIVGASAVSRKYGNLKDIINDDGFEIDVECHFLLEENIPLNMAQTCGLGLINIANALNSLSPDCLIIIGDRYEMLAATVAAAYMNIPILHTMGGEVTGTIDESVRHAISKFASFHFVANQDAATRLIRMGEVPETVFNVGCPRIDHIKNVLDETPDSRQYLADSGLADGGVGADIDFSRDRFIIYIFHPVTTEYNSDDECIKILIKKLSALDLKVVALWPNSDAGSDKISKIYRQNREQGNLRNFRFYRNLELDSYIHCMNSAACIVGNSSSGIRDSAFIGLPTINIGTRQNRRLRGFNVIDVDANLDNLNEAIISQLNKIKFDSDHCYGDGNAAGKMAAIIPEIDLTNTQKTITY